MIFRKANSKDKDTIKQIALRAYQKYIERMGKEPAPMRPNIQKNDIVFVCEKENKIIAFAILVIKDGNIFLENLAVEPLLQQKNVGTAFISFIENYLIKEKFDFYQLYTNEKMIENILWYQKIGFKKIREVTEKGFNRVYFQKQLYWNKISQTSTKNQNKKSDK